MYHFAALGLALSRLWGRGGGVESLSQKSNSQTNHVYASTNFTSSTFLTPNLLFFIAGRHLASEQGLSETGSRVELYRTPYLRNPASATGLVRVELTAA